jgi:ankyrin repeat protein
LQLEALTADVSNSTALHAAAIVNYAAGVAALLSGAEAAAMGVGIGMDAWALRLDAEGLTALHVAAAAGFTDVVEALLDGFVNISRYLICSVIVDLWLPKAHMIETRFVL